MYFRLMFFIDAFYFANDVCFLVNVGSEDYPSISHSSWECEQHPSVFQLRPQLQYLFDFSTLYPNFPILLPSPL